jgi:uncharacterized protein with FMN-binding domain
MGGLAEVAHRMMYDSTSHGTMDWKQLTDSRRGKRSAQNAITLFSGTYTGDNTAFVIRAFVSIAVNTIDNIQLVERKNNASTRFDPSTTRASV